MSEDTISSLEHFYGIRTVGARTAFSDGELEVPEALRKLLIHDLEVLPRVPQVQECLDYLRGNPWKTPEALDLLEKKYQELNPPKKDPRADLDLDQRLTI